MTEKTPESVGLSAADLLFGQLDEQFHIRQELMAGIQEEVDFGEVVNSEEFQNAPPEVRTRLAEKYGLDLPDEPADESQPEKAAAEAAEPRQAAESAEAAEVTFPVDLKAELEKRHPRKIIFTGYRLAWDKSGQPRLEETGHYFNRKTRQYEDYRNPPPVRIEFPEQLTPRLKELEVRQAVLEFAGKLRKHLGEGGLNLFFDRRRQQEGEPEQWNPKWKYAPDPDRPNRYREEYMTLGTDTWEIGQSEDADVAEVPWNVYQAVEEFRRGNSSDTPLSVLARQNPTYGDWYGKAIQSKRDQIVSQELAGREFEKMPTGTVTVSEQPAGQDTEKGAERSESPERALKPRAAVARRALRALRRESPTDRVETAEKLDSERLKKPETPKTPETAALELDIERLSADARPHIRTALKAMREIWKDDPKKQIKEAIRLTTDRLNEEYAREGLIPKGDSDSLTAYAEHMVQLARQETAALDFLAANQHLSADHFDLTPDGELEADLGGEAWSEALDQRAVEVIRQAIADGGLEISQENLERLAQTMAAAIREHGQTDFARLDQEKGRLWLSDWDGLKKMVRGVCRDFAKS